VTYKSLNIVAQPKGDAIDHVTVAATRNDLRRAATFKSCASNGESREAVRTARKRRR
jgi:hypothetical protein